MQILSDRVIFSGEDFYGGFAPNTLASAPTTDIRKLGRGYAFGKNYDPFVIPGFAYPGKYPTGLTNVVGGGSPVPDAAQVAGATGFGLTTAFTIGGDNVHQITNLTGTPAVNTTSPFPRTIAVGAVTHNEHTAIDASKCDIVIYQIGATNKVFYSWNDNTDWDVGMVGTAPAQDSDFDDDFMSVVPATKLGATAADLTNGLAKHHPLFVSQDGYMYIGSGRHVHRFDGQTGANGTFQSQFWILPQGYEVKGFAESQFDFYVFADSDANTGRRSQSMVFVFGANRGVNFDKAIPLDDDRVGAPFMFGGTVGCFTNNRAGANALRIYDGFTFAQKFTFSGALPTIGGVEIQDNLIKWNSSGKIWAYGSYRGFLPAGAHHIATVGNTSGFLKSLTGGTLFSSGGTGVDVGLVTFANYADVAEFSTLAAFPKFPAGMEGRIKQVDIAFAKTVADGRQVHLQVFTNNIQVALASSIEDITVSDRRRSYRYDANNNKLPHFTSVAFYCNWTSGSGATSAPGIESVTVYFEPVRQKNSY